MAPHTSRGSRHGRAAWSGVPLSCRGRPSERLENALGGASHQLMAGFGLQVDRCDLLDAVDVADDGKVRTPEHLSFPAAVQELDQRRLPAFPSIRPDTTLVLPAVRAG